MKIALKSFLRFLIEAFGELPLTIKKKRLVEIYDYFKVENIKDSLPELPPNLSEIVEKLIDHVAQPYKTILAIAYETGARRGEILNLKVGDVEDAEDYIKIRIRKNKSEARTVIVIRYQNVVREWLKLHEFKDNPSAPLFYTRTLRQVRSDTFYMYLARLKKKLEIIEQPSSMGR